MSPHLFHQESEGTPQRLLGQQGEDDMGVCPECPGRREQPSKYSSWLSFETTGQKNTHRRHLSHLGTTEPRTQ